jgi:hypothetical protein
VKQFWRQEAQEGRRRQREGRKREEKNPTVCVTIFDYVIPKHI